MFLFKLNLLKAWSLSGLSQKCYGLKNRFGMVEHASKIKREKLSARAQLENIFALFILNSSILAISLWSIGNMHSPVFILFSCVCICIHHHFLSEYLHEATHWNLLENKALNDVISLILIGIPFGTIPSLNRKSHFEHHAQLAFFTTRDVEGNRYTVSTRKGLYLKFLNLMTGASSIKYFISAIFFSHSFPSSSTTKVSKYWLIFLMLTHFGIIYLGYTIGFLPFYLLYYLILTTVYPIFAMLRFWGQHAYVPPNNSHNAFTYNSSVSRTNVGGILEFLFFNSPIMAYHYTHHLYPHLHYRQLKIIDKASKDPNKLGKGCCDMLVRVWRGVN